MSGCFVEASAGTGKTTALVNAIAEAIAGGVRVERIAAVTFTHQAAGEMKLRVRQKLEDMRTAATGEALQHLDRAFIGTIHAFCAALLRQRPVEARVDPAFVELDQGQARRLFSRVFGEWIEKRLDPPAPVLRRAFARLAWRDNFSGPVYELECAAWNLAEWRDHVAAWEKRPIGRDARIAELMQQARDMAQSWPSNEAGWARRILADIVERLERAKSADVFDPDDAESELISIRRRLRDAKLSKRTAAGQAWAELMSHVVDFARDADADLASHLRDELWEMVEQYQDSKRDAGYLDFTDLLLYARDLLRHDGARPELQARYDRIFVDEFQDTDPLQAEILTTLASPATLFVVGDPKQSIYRFRRAEPRVYAQVRERLLGAGAEERLLGQSYRATEPIQAFVNAAFAESIPRYLPISGGPPGPAGQPSVVALPMPKPYDSRDRIASKAILECSPSTVAAFIQWLVKESGWTVRERGGRRRIKAEDVCILFRRFTNNGVDLTQDYVRSLEARDIEHVLVGSKGLHAREETAAIRTALRAIEWPEDELSVYAVLHGPLFGIDDATLLRFRDFYRRLRPFAEPPEDFDPDFGPVWEAFAILRELHRERNRQPIAETIRQMLQAVRAHASFAFHNGGPRRLANLHRIAELARQADSGSLFTFRGFVRWLEEEAHSGESAEAPVLEQQANGVRLMTVHKAKGLEFPVVILADLSAGLTGFEGCTRWVDSDRGICAQRLLRCAPWELIDHEQEEEQAERDEATRLAYVAATRAKDLLVVCTLGDHEFENGWLAPLYDAVYPAKDRRRQAREAPGCPAFGHVTVLNPPAQPQEEQVRPGLHRPRVGGHDVVWFDPAVLALKDPPSKGAERENLLDGSRAQIEEGLARYREWKARRAAAIAEGSRPRFDVRRATEAGAVTEAASVPVEVVEIDVAPSLRGRRFGKLVHAVLQSGGGAEGHGRRWNATPAEVQAAEEIAQTVLAHPLVAPAEEREIFREMPVVVKLGDGSLVEGRIDLAWTDGNSWTVIDYKTDRADRSRYWRQLQLYGLALQQATGKPARGVILEIG